jgi:hypothetical protein
MKNPLSVSVLAIILAGFVCGIAFGVDSSTSTSAPAATTGSSWTVDVSMGLVGIAGILNYNGKSTIIPNFGPFFRVSGTLLNITTSPSATPIHALDLGVTLFATYGQTSLVSGSSVLLAGIGPGIGVLNDAITLSIYALAIATSDSITGNWEFLLTSTAIKF